MRNKYSQPGELNPRCKIPERCIPEIRHSRESCVQLALRYGVAPQTIGDIRARRTWKHVL